MIFGVFFCDQILENIYDHHDKAFLEIFSKFCSELGLFGEGFALIMQFASTLDQHLSGHFAWPHFCCYQFLIFFL